MVFVGIMKMTYIRQKSGNFFLGGKGLEAGTRGRDLLQDVKLNKFFISKKLPLPLCL